MFPNGSARRWLNLLGVCLVAAALVVLAGCGGSDDTTSSGGTTGGDETQASSGGVEAAQEAVAPYLKEPEGNGITTPLSKAPPKDKLIASVQCNLPVCKYALDSIGEAADKLGWRFKPIVSDGTPEDIVAKIESALALKPDGLIINGFSREVTEPALQKAEAQKVPVVNSGVPDEVEPPYIAVITNTPLFERDGETLANYAVADSNGDAHVALFNMPVFPILNSMSDTFEATVTEQCPECSVKRVDGQLTDIGTDLPKNVVSTIQANPDINYVAFTDGNFAAGVSAALAGAGLADKVKIIGQNGAEPNIQGVLDGTENAWLAYPVGWISWADVDALARHFVGDPQIDDPLAAPTILQTAENTESTEPWNPPGYQEAFEKLWLVD